MLDASLSRTAKFHALLSGVEPPETDTGDRHVVGRRAPADQQVSPVRLGCFTPSSVSLSKVMGSSPRCSSPAGIVRIDRIRES
jgi:hypothetical protein